MEAKAFLYIRLVPLLLMLHSVIHFQNTISKKKNEFRRVISSLESEIREIWHCMNSFVMCFQKRLLCYTSSILQLFDFFS